MTSLWSLLLNWLTGIVAWVSNHLHCFARNVIDRSQNDENIIQSSCNNVNGDWILKEYALDFVVWERMGDGG